MVMANALAEVSSRFKEVTFIMLIKNFSWIYWLKLLKDGSATFPPKTPPHSLGPGFQECMISIESPPLGCAPIFHRGGQWHGACRPLASPPCARASALR